METEPTVIDRSAIDILMRLQERTGHGDDKFARRHLGKSGSMWNRIKSGEYFSMISQEQITKLLTELSLKAKVTQRNIDLAARRQTGRFVKFDHIEAITIAIDECLAKTLADPDRLITFLAPTGGGKTALSHYLRAEYDAVVVEARESWMRSYFTACCDIADAMALDRSQCFSPSQLEDLMIGELKDRAAQVLVIDEGEFFGAQAANLIKLLLNKTNTVIVICAIPTAFERWTKRNSHESQQLRRRTHVTITHEQVSVAEVADLLNGDWPAAERKAMAAPIAQAANRFGLLDLCTRVVNRLREDKRAELKEAINDAKKAMGMKD